VSRFPSHEVSIPEICQKCDYFAAIAGISAKYLGEREEELVKKRGRQTGKERFTIHASLCGGGDLLNALGSVASYLADSLCNLSNDRLKGRTNMATYEKRRDERFYSATIAVLKDIEERALQLPQEQRYAAAYGILRGYFESLLTNFAEAFSSEQLAEIRIVLDQLSKVTGEDYHLDEATKTKLDQLAQALRESE
jgi:hypothetical protein